jgi:uncharacterized RDD family membrane protein YckC
MTRGFRNQQPGRGSQRPGGRGGRDQQEGGDEEAYLGPSAHSPRLRDTSEQSQQASPANWREKIESLDKYGDSETLIQPVRVDFGRRLVAALIDVFAAYLLGVVVSFIPFANIFLHLQLTMVIFLIVRDFFFGGRGIGKNLMGLQVVDVMTGEPASFIQSIKRNVVIFGPTLVLYLVISVTKVAPVPWLSDFVRSAIELAGTIYTVVVVPYEAYRTYACADGRRLGDLLAGTAVVESNMDFSKPVQRQ